MPVLQSDDVAFSIELNTPLPAPIAQGQQIGELVIDVPTLGERRVPLRQKPMNMGGFFHATIDCGTNPDAAPSPKNHGRA